MNTIFVSVISTSCSAGRPVLGWTISFWEEDRCRLILYIALYLMIELTSYMYRIGGAHAYLVWCSERAEYYQSMRSRSQLGYRQILWHSPISVFLVGARRRDNFMISMLHLILTQIRRMTASYLLRSSLSAATSVRGNHQAHPESLDYFWWYYLGHARSAGNERSLWTD